MRAPSASISSSSAANNASGDVVVVSCDMANATPVVPEWWLSSQRQQALARAHRYARRPPHAARQPDKLLRTKPAPEPTTPLRLQPERRPGRHWPLPD